MKTADLMDDFQDEVQSCEIQFRNYGGRIAFWGPCRTVSCQNDNVLLKQTLGKPASGHVLVVDGNGSFSSALIGDMIAEIAFNNHWSGVVINGVIRDTVEIGGIDIGVKALGSNPRKSKKQGAGSVDVRLSLGNIMVAPGDWVYCDADGVVVANRELPLGKHR